MTLYSYLNTISYRFLDMVKTAIHEVKFLNTDCKKTKTKLTLKFNTVSNIEILEDKIKLTNDPVHTVGSH